jgi:hypothetical protein
MSESPLDHIPGSAIKLILDSLGLPQQREYFRQVLLHLRYHGHLSLTDYPEFRELLDKGGDLAAWIQHAQEQIRAIETEVIADGEGIIAFFWEIDDVIVMLAEPSSEEARLTCLSRLEKLLTAAAGMSAKATALYEGIHITQFATLDEASRRIIMARLLPIAESLMAIRGALDFVATALLTAGAAEDMAAQIRAAAAALVLPHVDWIHQLDSSFGQDSSDSIT